MNRAPMGKLGVIPAIQYEFDGREFLMAIKNYSTKPKRKQGSEPNIIIPLILPQAAAAPVLLAQARSDLLFN